VAGGYQARERRVVSIRELAEKKRRRQSSRVPVSLLLSRSASGRLILEQLPQRIFDLPFDLGVVNGVFMPDSEYRFFAELLRVVNTANDQFKRLCWVVAFFDPLIPSDLALMTAVIRSMMLLARLRPAVVTAKYTKISGPLSCSSNANEPSGPDSLIKQLV
jgi:hypothetical protein